MITLSKNPCENQGIVTKGRKYDNKNKKRNRVIF